MPGSPVQITPVPPVQAPSAPGPGTHNGIPGNWTQENPGWVFTPTSGSSGGGGGGGGGAAAPATDTGTTVNVNFPDWPEGPKPTGRPAEAGFWQSGDQYSYAFDHNWYNKHRPDVQSWAEQWLRGDKNKTHWGDYTRINQDLEAEFQRQDKYDTRWEYGKYHWDTYGEPNKEDRLMPFVIGDSAGQSPSQMQTILGRSGRDWIDNKSLQYKQAMEDLSQWHFESFGRDEARSGGGDPKWGYGSEMAWFNSPDQVKAREQEFLDQEAQIAADQQAYKEKTAAAAESLRLQGKRMSSRQDVQVGGAADVRSKEVASSAKKRGTSKFKATRSKSQLGKISDRLGGLGNLGQVVADTGRGLNL